MKEHRLRGAQILGSIEEPICPDLECGLRFGTQLPVIFGNHLKVLTGPPWHQHMFRAISYGPPPTPPHISTNIAVRCQQALADWA